MVPPVMSVCAIAPPSVNRNGGMLARIFDRITDAVSRTRRMTADDIRARGESALADAAKMLTSLEATPPKERDPLLRAVDGLQLALTNAASPVSVLMNVHPD